MYLTDRNDIKEQLNSFIPGKTDASEKNNANDDLRSDSSDQGSSNIPQTEVVNSPQVKDDSKELLRQMQNLVDKADPTAIPQGGSIPLSGPEPVEEPKTKWWYKFDSANDPLTANCKVPFSINHPPNYIPKGIDYGRGMIEMLFKPIDSPDNLNRSLKITSVNITSNFKKEDGTYDIDEINDFFARRRTEYQQVFSSKGLYYEGYPAYDMVIISGEKYAAINQSFASNVRVILIEGGMLTLQCWSNVEWSGSEAAVYNSRDYKNWVSNYCSPFLIV
jgi:hypothetical protein